MFGKVLIINLVFAFSSMSMASDNKVIYGDDDRVHLRESSVQRFKNLAHSTAAMIPKSALEFKYNGLLALLTGRSLQKSARVCEDERFSKIVTAAHCSGFLVGPDLLVTAGHCIRSQFSCNSNFWVFDYRSELVSLESKTYLDSETIYSCKKIVEQFLVGTGADYALIQLDRKVKGREPLKFRTEGKVKTGTELVVIGHPSGLPTIIADGAKVRENDHADFFQSNLDTFGGNSGSAVINVETELVEGILVRGETDYRWDAEAGCRRVFECENDKCRGEDVTRITKIKSLMPKKD